MECPTELDDFEVTSMLSVATWSGTATWWSGTATCDIPIHVAMKRDAVYDDEPDDIIFSDSDRSQEDDDYNEEDLNFIVFDKVDHLKWLKKKDRSRVKVTKEVANILAKKEARKNPMDIQHLVKKGNGTKENPFIIN